MIKKRPRLMVWVITIMMVLQAPLKMLCEIYKVPLVYDFAIICSISFISFWILKFLFLKLADAEKIIAKEKVLSNNANTKEKV